MIMARLGERVTARSMERATESTQRTEGLEARGGSFAPATSISINPESATGNTDMAGNTVVVGAINPTTEAPEVSASRRCHVPRGSDTELSEFFARPVLVDTITVAPTVVSHTLASNSVFAQWSATTAVARKLTGFGYFRGDLCVRLTYTGNPQAVGTLNYSFYPAATGTWDNIQASTPTWFPGYANAIASNFQLPHITVHYEEVCSCDLRLGWPSAADFQAISGYEDFYTNTSIVNAFGVTSGATPTNLTLLVYAWYENVELYAPVVAQMAVDEDGGSVAVHAGYAAAVSAWIGRAVPVVTSWMHAAKGVAAAVALMGFSRPIHPAQTAMQCVQSSTLAYMGGQPDFSEKLSSNPAVSSDQSQVIPLSTPGETSVASLQRRWGLLAWQEAPGALSAPAGYRCDPLVVPLYVAAAGGFTAGYQELTPLAWLTAMFQGYNGPLEFRFEFVGNSFMRCTFAIQTIPVGSTVPAAISLTSGFETVLVEAVGRTVVDVVVPYSAPYPITLNASVFSSFITPSTGYPTLLVGAVNAVQCSTTTPPVYYYNVYVRAGEGFQLMYPGFTYTNSTPPIVNSYSLGLSSVNGYVPQMADDGVLAMQLTGEYVGDVNLLARRPCLNFLAAMIWANTITLSVPVAGCVPATALALGGTASNITLTGMSWTMSQWVASAFLGSTGGFRHKWVLNGTTAPANVISAACLPYCNSGQTSSAGQTFFGTLHGCQDTSGGISVQDYRFRTVLEFEAPFKGVGRFRYNRLCYSGNGNANQEGVSYSCIGNTTTQNSLLFVSGADDFRVGGFLCPPVLAFQP